MPEIPWSERLAGKSLKNGRWTVFKEELAPRLPQSMRPTWYVPDLPWVVAAPRGSVVFCGATYELAIAEAHRRARGRTTMWVEALYP